MRILVIIFLSFSLLFSKECVLDKKILYSIMLNEGLKNKIGYEYIISFNNYSDVKRIKKTVIAKYLLNDRVLDCKNPIICKAILKKLSDSNIKNLDVGAFQINHKVHNLPLATYFDLKNSYKFACNYITGHIKKYGYNWYAIASYHSQTPYYNKIYQKNLKKNYNKVKERLK